MTATEHILYGAAWASFGVGHSLLARPAARAWLERRLGGGSRLAYNLVAAAHFSAVLALGGWLLDWDRYFDLPLGVRIVMYMTAGAGALLILGTLLRHGIGRFLGLRPAVDDGTLDLGGPYRWVRHPMYLGTFLLLGGLAQGPFGVATAAWGSLYILIGVRFEEGDLARQFGEPYGDYQRRVPRFFPRLLPARHR